MRTLVRTYALAAALVVLVAPVALASVTVAAGPTMAASTAPSHSARPSLGALAALAGVAFGITIAKDAATIANKFKTRAVAAAGDYKDGVAGAGGLWETNTKASEDNWAQGTQEAIADKRFGRNVTGSANKYQENAVKLGSTRYGPGITNAQDAYARGIAPVLDKLKSIQLPPKGPRRSPQNQQRANMVALELGKLVTGK